MATATSTNSDPLNRVPPQSIEAEQGVLGSILLDNEVLHDVIPLLRREHFYREAHQKIYRTICEIYERGASELDALILREELKTRGLLDEVGGAPYLGEILASVPHAANAQY
ncbi:MAG: DnaB-like helicase N-terminal domain-containing protein, partial [Pirellulales bacterium]